MSMVTHWQDGLCYLTFTSFERSGICKHGFSTRLGGVSTGMYESLNLRLGHNDDELCVMENFARVCSALKLELPSLVLSMQVHDTRIYSATEDDCGKGILRENDYGEVDGLVTDRPGVTLVTFYADCVPLFFLDTRRRAAALAHAGWKGSLYNIAGIMTARMVSEYGCRPEDILVGIGPSIGPCCFEVDEPVARMFRVEFAEFVTDAAKPEKSMVDLWGVNRKRLINAGIPARNISMADECTKCNTGKYYSHRQTGDDRGCMGAFLQLC